MLGTYDNESIYKDHSLLTVGFGVGAGVGLGVGLRVGEGVGRPLYVCPLEFVNLDAKQLFLFQLITMPPLACEKETR